MPRAHATVADLAERARVQQLAEACSPNSRSRLDADHLDAAIEERLDDIPPGLRADAANALTRLERRIDDANAEVDGYLSRYPDLPPDARALTVYAVDIALWRILGGDSGSERYERYKAALAFLRLVASGEVNLAVDGAGAGGDAGGGRARSASAKPALRRDQVSGL